MPCWRKGQRYSNRRQREDGKQTSPDIYRVDAMPRDQVVNRAGQYEFQAQKSHQRLMLPAVVAGLLAAAVPQIPAKLKIPGCPP
jgi:hypothetical protein